MTAIAERRRKRTQVGAGLALVLVIVAAGLTAVGANTVINSTAGEVVQGETRDVIALPQTDNAALAVVDDDNRLTSLVVVTLLPSGEGGSIVTIPVDADASIGLGDQRRPLDGVLDPADPDGFFEAVEETLAIALQFGEIVGADRLAELIGPATPISVDLPFAPVLVSETEPDDEDDAATEPGEATADTEPGTDSGDATVDTEPGSEDSDATLPEDEAGDAEADTTTTTTSTTTDASDEPQPDDALIELLDSNEFDVAGAVDVLRSTPRPGTNADRQRNDVAMWSALAATAPVDAGFDVAVDEFGAPDTAASIDEVFARLWQGSVQVRDLAVASAQSSTDDDGFNVSVIDRFDALVVFAQISPARVSTPNQGLVFRVEIPISNAQLAGDGSPFDSRSEVARTAVGQLLFLQANVSSVDATPNPDGAPEVTRVEVADEQFIDDLKSIIVPVFGKAEFVISDELIDGIDVVMTLGTGYLDAIAGDAAAPSDDDADTVDADG